jgi:hypothetical protein
MGTTAPWLAYCHLPFCGTSEDSSNLENRITPHFAIKARQIMLYRRPLLLGFSSPLLLVYAETLLMEVLVFKLCEAEARTSKTDY